MGPRLRRLSSRELLRGLVGFEVVATRGSHAKLRRVAASGERQTLTIPLRPELSAGTLRAIFRQASRFAAESELRPLFFAD